MAFEKLLNPGIKQGLENLSATALALL